MYDKTVWEGIKKNWKRKKMTESDGFIHSIQ